MTEAIILAGGFGTRLRSVVADLPKPMAPVAGRPFLAWQLDFLRAQGVRRFILSVGYLADSVISYFGSEYEGCEVRYVTEDQPLGTGGAIMKSLAMLEGERSFVLNGDSMCDVDLWALRQRVGGGADRIGVFVKSVADVQRYGSVGFCPESGRVLAFGEKNREGAGFINAGVYDIPKSLAERVACVPPFSFEVEVLQHFSEFEIFAARAGDFFIDIGVPEDYLKAQVAIPEWMQAKGGCAV